jgi:hypothetical protein
LVRQFQQIISQLERFQWVGRVVFLFPEQLLVASPLRMLVGRPAAFAFTLHQFPGVFDYIFRESHRAPPDYLKAVIISSHIECFLEAANTFEVSGNSLYKVSI